MPDLDRARDKDNRPVPMLAEVIDAVIGEHREGFRLLALSTIPIGYSPTAGAHVLRSVAYQEPRGGQASAAR